MDTSSITFGAVIAVVIYVLLVAWGLQHVVAWFGGPDLSFWQSFVTTFVASALIGSARSKS